jgi:hypothetical protein
MRMLVSTQSETIAFHTNEQAHSCKSYSTPEEVYRWLSGELEAKIHEKTVAEAVVWERCGVLWRKRALCALTRRYYCPAIDSSVGTLLFYSEWKLKLARWCFGSDVRTLWRFSFASPVLLRLAKFLAFIISIVVAFWFISFAFTYTSFFASLLLLVSWRLKPFREVSSSCVFIFVRSLTRYVSMFQEPNIKLIVFFISFNYLLLLSHCMIAEDS